MDRISIYPIVVIFGSTATLMGEKISVVLLMTVCNASMQECLNN